MVREIKFKAYDLEKKKMIHSVSMELFHKDKRLELMNTLFFINKNLVYLQYTGLRDKNNKEIYDGDIVAYVGYSHEKGIAEVAYKDARFYLVHHWIMKGTYGDKHMTNDGLALGWTVKDRQVEVLGNIYTNDIKSFL